MTIKIKMKDEENRKIIIIEEIKENIIFDKLCELQKLLKKESSLIKLCKKQ